MNIKVFYHVIDLPGWYDITREQLTKLAASGLLENCELHINLNYNEQSFDQLKAEWPQANIHWHFKENVKEDYEHPTAILMKEHADATDQEFYILYMHQKGITYVGKENEEPVAQWRWLMDYWCIERWQDCVAALDHGYDTAGVNYVERHKGLGPHYSGTQSWVKASFLRTCRPLVLPSTIDYRAQIAKKMKGDVWRYDIEAWFGHSHAHAYCIYHSGLRDHYIVQHPPELYRGLAAHDW